jgi:glutaredoxin
MRNERIAKFLVLIIAVCVLVPAEAKIIVYSAPWCGFCVRLEKYLKEHTVRFEKINIDRNPAAKKELERKSGQRGIPVLDWNGEIIVGFGNDQAKEIYRLIAGGTPSAGRFALSKTTETTDTTPEPNEDPFYSQVENLKNLFAVAQTNVYEANAVDIIKKLYNAHLARLVYESAFTDQFRRRIERACDNNSPANREIIEAAKIIAASRYVQAIKAYRSARTKDAHASIEVQKALKLAVTQKDKADIVSLDQNQQGYFLKLWYCAAFDPRTGYKLQPGSTAKFNSRRDAIAVEAAKLLDEMIDIPQVDDPNGVEEPNEPEESNQRF